MAEERRERNVLWFFLGAVKANKIFLVVRLFLREIFEDILWLGGGIELAPSPGNQCPGADIGNIAIVGLGQRLEKGVYAMKLTYPVGFT